MTNAADSCYDQAMEAFTQREENRPRFPGRNALFMSVLAVLMLPNIVTLIPTSLLMRYLHWIDTLLPLIVPAWFGVTPDGGAFSVDIAAVLRQLDGRDAVSPRQSSEQAVPVIEALAWLHTHVAA